MDEDSIHANPDSEMIGHLDGSKSFVIKCRCGGGDAVIQEDGPGAEARAWGRWTIHSEEEG
jgi:hypothetical protein